MPRRTPSERARQNLWQRYKFKKNRAKQVWIRAEESNGTIYEVVYKATYGLWFRDAINRQHKPHAAPKWIVCKDQGLEELCSEHDDVQVTTCTLTGKAKFKPVPGSIYTVKTRKYSVERGYKPWEVAPAWYCDDNVYKTNKFKMGDWVGWYELPVNDSSLMVDEFGQPASSEDRNKYLVKVPKHLEAVSAQYPNDPLVDMLAAGHANKQQRTEMRQRVDEEVSQKMDNGVRLNPLLQRMYAPPRAR